MPSVMLNASGIVTIAETPASASVKSFHVDVRDAFHHRHADENQRRRNDGIQHGAGAGRVAPPTIFTSG